MEDQLVRQAAELAHRLGATQFGSEIDSATLDDLEYLATRLLKEVASARIRHTQRMVGESSGMWRAMQPCERKW